MFSETQREIAVDEELRGLVEQFLRVYLPRHRGCSNYTVVSYETAICQFVTWVADIGGSLSGEIRPVGVLDFNKSQVMDWLWSIEEGGCCAATRNHKLASLRSFMSFVADEKPEYGRTYFSLEHICWKKKVTPARDFLSMEELRCIMRSIDGNGDSSIRHYVMLCVLYESGARIQELRNIKVEDITFDGLSYIKILGKGKKYRNAYISGNVAVVIKEYCRHMGITEGPLFMSYRGKQISDDGVNYIIKRYTSIAAQKMPSLRGKRVTAHTLRRSKATHMLQNGANLALIQHFLGHESLRTTENYLDVGIRDMIEAMSRSHHAVYTTYQFWNTRYWQEVLQDNTENINKNYLEQY